MLHSFHRFSSRAGAQSIVTTVLRQVPNLRALSTSRILLNGFSGLPDSAVFDLPALDLKWQREWQNGSPIWRGEGMPRPFTVSEDGGLVEAAPEKMYILPMFPYPSGDLHLGHLRVYTISDVLARFRRLQGYQVTHPIGWDAFGLPAENAAIERGIHPAVWTKQNIQKMKTQLEAMNGAWDWDRELATCDPSFYKHTQRLFLLLYGKGLAYQSEAMVNYDPIDKTVLANEQVDANGRSWRSGAQVEKKLLKQWFFKISEFRDELLHDLEQLSKDGSWPENVLTMQKHWIGKSDGARIKFEVTFGIDDTLTQTTSHFPRRIEVFTTRPDTLHGVQYIAIAPNHPIVLDFLQNKENDGLQAFINSIPSLPPDSKAGYKLYDLYAHNPLSANDSYEERLPIFVAPYVLGDYGEGAVMGVPGHDARDHEFWTLNAPGDKAVRTVVEPLKADVSTAVPFIHRGKLTAACGMFAGMGSKEAGSEIVALLQSKGWGDLAETWRLRDWLISRQRYWGTPIPIVHCGSCGPVPVPEDQLPVELPNVLQHWAEGRTGNPLESAHDWINTACPQCHRQAKRDTDTMDTFVDSSWYFMRFIDPKNSEELFSTKIAEEMLPVDLYVGGVEHAILHLLYARFISKFVAKLGLWPSKNNGEPFKRVLTQGMVHGKTFSDPVTGRFLKPDEVDVSEPSKPVIISSGATPAISFQKMSKSKYNGVDPGKCIAKYGADATRAHMLFQAPVSDVLEWDESKIAGVTRWLRKIHVAIQTWQGDFQVQMHSSRIKNPPMRDFLIEWNQDLCSITAEQNPQTYLRFMRSTDQRLGRTTCSNDDAPTPGELEQAIKIREQLLRQCQQNQKLWRRVQQTIISATQSYAQTLSLNTVVSDFMSLTNTIIEHSNELTGKYNDQPSILVIRSALKALIQMMAPITPAFSEECWMLLHQGSRPFELTPEDLEVDLSQNILDPAAMNSNEPARSIFTFPFPVYDGSLEAFAQGATTIAKTCAVQVNGKLRFAVDLDIPVDLEGEALKTWLVERLPATEIGREKLSGQWDIERAKKVIVVKNGQTVNFVIPPL